jgi:hypothetical protein
MTIVEHPSLLFNLSKLREKSFARIWVTNGISLQASSHLGFFE